MASTGFARGSKAWGHCQRCGFRYLLSELIHDGQIEGLQVCDECWDPKHPQERLPTLFDPMALKHATGDMDAASASVVPPAPSIAWSMASISGDGSTATLAYANASLLSVGWAGDDSGMGFSFDGTTLTLLAGDAEPGVSTGVIRAIAVDALGVEFTADLSVEITVVQPEPSFNASYDVGFYSFDASGILIALQATPDGGLILSDYAGYNPPTEVVLDGVLEPLWNPGFDGTINNSTTIPSNTPAPGSYNVHGSVISSSGALFPGFVGIDGTGTILLNNGQGFNWNGFTGDSTASIELLVEVRRTSDDAVVATTTLNLFFSESAFGGYT